MRVPISKLSSAKYIFVTGGVMSGVGKGVTTASIAYLLKRNGYKIALVKCENYLNVDSGTINPIEHGDPFLTEDGLEADMDLGTYERFLNEDMKFENYITMGQIYKTVIDRERSFGYNGKTVEPVEAIANEIILRLRKAQSISNAEIVVVELGGTAGEYQNIMYYEASRMMKYRHKDQVVHIHVAYAPIPPHLGEPKSKPVQLSVQTLNSMGIQPDFIVIRSEKLFDTKRKEKLSMYCNIEPEDIIANPDLKSIYELPSIFHKQNFETKILQKFSLKPKKKSNLSELTKLINNIQKPKDKSIEIGIVGKYFGTGDYNFVEAYASLIDAVKHASWSLQVEVKFRFINSEKQENEIPKNLHGLNGIIVPIGWGERGSEGKIKAIKYARETKTPYLGLCFGMQLAAIEYARSILGWSDSNSQEIDPDTSHPIIHAIPEEERYQRIKAKGVSMRLGAFDCLIKEGTLAYNIYDKHNAWKDKKNLLISERHRHRYEFNNFYRKDLEKAGLVFSGTSPDDFFVEIIELPKKIHPFFIATQAHPEYKSRPTNPHPMFIEFLKACLN